MWWASVRPKQTHPHLPRVGSQPVDWNATVHTVYFLIRRTTDWKDERAFLAQLSPDFAGKVHAWNETFSMPYHLFRHAIRDIAIANHSAIEGVEPASWDSIPDRAVVLPSDDDDWFSPAVASSMCRGLEDHHVGAVWTQSALEVPINGLHRINLLARRVVPWIKPKWFCATNNYCFRKGLVPDDARAHTHASRYFSSGGSAVAEVRARLSIHNRSLASITSMGFGKPGISRSELRRKADAYRRLYERPALHAELSWAAAELRAMRHVMANLRLRKC